MLFFKALPLIFLGISFLALAWYLSPYYIFFSLAICATAQYRFVYIRSWKYLITPEYIRIDSGIFFKKIDQVELYRVKDYIVTQSFIMQLFSLMDLTLKSTDHDNAVVQLLGIPQSDITAIIRDRVKQTRHNNNIVELN